MNTDIYFNIVPFIDEKKQLFTFRRLCKDSNIEFMNFLKLMDISVSPQRTMIRFNVCMCCDSIIKNQKNQRMLHYYFDEYPERLLLYCNKYICFLAIIKRYLNDIKYNAPFIQFNIISVNLLRTSGKLIYGKIDAKKTIIRDKIIYVYVSFDNKYKYIPLDTLKQNNNITVKSNLFQWNHNNNI